MNNIDKPTQSTDVTSLTTEGLSVNERVVIPVIEEQIQVGKRVVETGRFRIAKTIREEEQTVDIPLLHEEFNVERVAVNQYVDAPPTVRQDGETTIYPVLKEVLVIEKRLVLVEEVHITRRQIETSDTQQVTIRKEEVTVERITNDGERPV
jgi:uncharacterized protein (TIGR02271 family)